MLCTLATNVLHFKVPRFLQSKSMNANPRVRSGRASPWALKASHQHWTLRASRQRLSVPVYLATTPQIQFIGLLGYCGTVITIYSRQNPSCVVSWICPWFECEAWNQDFELKSQMWHHTHAFVDHGYEITHPHFPSLKVLISHMWFHLW